MVESRCGIECRLCAAKKDDGCAGCVSIINPYWGECPVKSCAEVRGYEHCGMCGEIPCELLSAFSYDTEHGDGGRRIETCIKWRESEEKGVV